MDTIYEGVGVAVHHTLLPPHADDGQYTREINIATLFTGMRSRRLQA